MLRLSFAAILIVAACISTYTQTPGIDPRGVAIHSSPVIIGLVEEPWQKVIRPDKLPKGSVKTIPQPDGTKIVEFPPISRDYLVGHIYHVRVQEILKGEPGLTTNQVIRVFVPMAIEGGVSLPPKRRFLLALARFEPKKEDFSATSVSSTSEPLTKPGVPFDLRARYYQVSDRNGAIAITEKNSRLIEEIRTAIRKTRYR